jgi:hypothetical protein
MSPPEKADTVLKFGSLSPEAYVTEAAYYSSDSEAILIMSNLYKYPTQGKPVPAMFKMSLDGDIEPEKTAPEWLDPIKKASGHQLPFNLWWRNYAVFEYGDYIYAIQGSRYWSYQRSSKTAFGPFSIDEFGLNLYDVVTAVVPTEEEWFIFDNREFKGFSPSRRDSRIEGNFSPISKSVNDWIDCKKLQESAPKIEEEISA